MMKVKFAAVCFLLLISACGAKRVYFECGARVDVVDVQGLVLSPGFPYNYSSGTHCVWQFFVPVGHQLTMEMFEFDVFERNPASEGVMDDDGKKHGSSVDALLPKAGHDMVKEPQRSNDEAKQMVVQEDSNQRGAAKISNSGKRYYERSSPMPPDPPPSQLFSGPQTPGDKAQNAISPQVSRSDSGPRGKFAAMLPTTPAMIGKNEALSPETQQPVTDTCPHDVLYISDLISFSSRFCGSKRPSSEQLTFGSDAEMVEVIMELITTTHWGRGFALLFRYHNHTQPTTAGGHRAVASPSGGMDVLLAAVCGAAFFTMVLASILCVILRNKLCAKGSNTTASINSEVPEGEPHSAADGSELQLVASNHTEQQIAPENDTTTSKSHTGSVSGGCDVSQNAELCSEGLTELELGTDEVFVISSAPNSAGPPFSSHTRERFLRHSDTGPVQPSDWPTGVGPAGSGLSSRPRAWSVRTFHDFLPPLPQLHRRWCSWNSTSPFTKLVDSGPPSSVADAADDVRVKVLSDGQLQKRGNGFKAESSESTASYPLSHSAQRQRRLNSTSNLRRSRFNGPCFSLQSSTPPGGVNNSTAAAHQLPDPSSTPSGQQQQQQKPGEAAVGENRVRSLSHEDTHVSVPVFAISEEDDRQPLVLSEDIARPLTANGRSYEGPKKPLSPTHSATTMREDSVLKNNKIQLPSLSQASVHCSLMGKDM
ncbi:uncharacterized protein [Hoplias malabaricus]|uniref:uncharacterized protein isoform X2 n=1 Tax=Hoplias malabaricus TaxID=27720 RepID=UPI003462004F